MGSKNKTGFQQRKADIKIGDRSYSDLSPSEKQFLYMAANIMVEWLLQEAAKRNEASQPKLLGSGITEA